MKSYRSKLTYVEIEAIYKEVLRLRAEKIGHKKMFQHLKKKYKFTPSITTIRDWIKRRNNPVRKLDTGSNFAYSLMALLGDGGICFNKCSIQFKTRDEEFATKLADALAKSLKRGKPYKVSYLPKEESFRIALSNRRIYELLREAKNDPEKIYQYLCLFPADACRGFFDAEGSVDVKSKFVEASNTSLKLIRIVQKLLQQLGISSKIHEWRRRDLYFMKNGKMYRRKEIVYRLRICGKEELFRFYKLVGFTLSRKQKRLEALLSSYTR